MKNAATPTLRALRTRAVAPARAFSSSACSRDASAEAESSSSLDKTWSFNTHYRREEGESRQEAWLRNLNAARDFRRKYAGVKSKVPLYVPESVKEKVTPPSPTEASLSTLMASGAALGHAKELQDPSYLPYVYGTRSGLSIIDLEQTLPMLRRAASVVRDVVKDDGTVVFLGSRPAHKPALLKAKERLGDNGYIVQDWIGGTLTNAESIFGLDAVLNGTYLPNLLVVLNPSENIGAIRECTARNVPTIGIIDTDTDPRIVTYAIPANMESVRTAELIAATLSIAGAEGRRVRLRDARQRELRKQRDRSWITANKAKQAEGANSAAEAN